MKTIEQIKAKIAEHENAIIDPKNLFKSQIADSECWIQALKWVLSDD